MANGNSLAIQSPFPAKNLSRKYVWGCQASHSLCIHALIISTCSSRKMPDQEFLLKKNSPLHLNPQYSQFWVAKAPAHLTEPSQTASFRSIPCSKSHIWTSDIPACSQPSLHPEQTDPPSPEASPARNQLVSILQNPEWNADFVVLTWWEGVGTGIQPRGILLAPLANSSSTWEVAVGNTHLPGKEWAAVITTVTTVIGDSELYSSPLSVA